LADLDSEIREEATVIHDSDVQTRLPIQRSILSSTVFLRLAYRCGDRLMIVSCRPPRNSSGDNVVPAKGSDSRLHNATPFITLFFTHQNF